MVQTLPRHAWTECFAALAKTSRFDFYMYLFRFCISFLFIHRLSIHWVLFAAVAEATESNNNNVAVAFLIHIAVQIYKDKKGKKKTYFEQKMMLFRRVESMSPHAGTQVPICHIHRFYTLHRIHTFDTCKRRDAAKLVRQLIAFDRLPLTADKREKKNEEETTTTWKKVIFSEQTI